MPLLYSLAYFFNNLSKHTRVLTPWQILLLAERHIHFKGFIHIWPVLVFVQQEIYQRHLARKYSITISTFPKTRHIYDFEWFVYFVFFWFKFLTLTRLLLSIFLLFLSDFVTFKTFPLFCKTNKHFWYVDREHSLQCVEQLFINIFLTFFELADK